MSKINFQLDSWASCSKWDFDAAHAIARALKVEVRRDDAPDHSALPVVFYHVRGRINGRIVAYDMALSIAEVSRCLESPEECAKHIGARVSSEFGYYISTEVASQLPLNGGFSDEAQPR